jgi:hypothetical protein
LETSGWELTIDYGHRFENGLGINFRGNISDSKSILTEYGTGTQVTVITTGKTIGEIWGYRTNRLYQNEDFELDAMASPYV